MRIIEEAVEQFSRIGQERGEKMRLSTPAGEPLTLAGFIQREQALDATQGTVTNHAITNFCIATMLASYTVKATRGEHRFRDHPRVIKEGDQWKIITFDSRQLNLDQGSCLVAGGYEVSVSALLRDAERSVSSVSTTTRS